MTLLSAPVPPRRLPRAPASLRDLAAVLGRPAALFLSTDGDRILVSSATLRAHLPRQGPVEPVLVMGAISSCVVHVAPGDPPWHPPRTDGDCLVHVLSGLVRAVTPDELHDLAEGDALACRADAVRSFRAVDGPARLLVATVAARRPWTPDDDRG